MSHVCDGLDPSCAACAAMRRRMDSVRAAMTTDDHLDDIKRARIWTQIEDRLADAPPPRRVRGPLLIGFAAVAAAAAAIALVVRAPGDASHTLAVPVDTTVTSQLGPYTAAAIVGPAQLDLLGPAGAATAVRVHRGTLMAEFAGGAGRSLRIVAPGAVIEVVGTLFAVEVRGETTCTSVSHGRVRVTTARGAVEVSDGQRHCVGEAVRPISDDMREALDRHGAAVAVRVQPAPGSPVARAAGSGLAGAASTGAPGAAPRADSASIAAVQPGSVAVTGAAVSAAASSGSSTAAGAGAVSASSAPSVVSSADAAPGTPGRSFAVPVPSAGTRALSAPGSSASTQATAAPQTNAASGTSPSRGGPSAGAPPSARAADARTVAAAPRPSARNPADTSTPGRTTPPGDLVAATSTSPHAIEVPPASPSLPSASSSSAPRTVERGPGLTHRQPAASAPQVQATVPVPPDVVPAPSPPKPTADELYRTAENALAASDPAAADRSLAALIDSYPASVLLDQAVYERARIAYQQRAWPAARTHLARLATIPSSRLAEPGRYLRCRIALETQEPTAAACLTSYRAAFPRSPHDLDALARLADLAHARGGCTAAAELVDELVQRYPRTTLAAAWATRCPESR